jgi:hypothetical protein
MPDYLILPIITGVAGLTHILRGGDIRITSRRVVRESLGRPLALLLVVASAIDLVTVLGFQTVVYASLIALIAAIVLGLAVGE